jgi:hypothetical protein
MKNDDYSLTSVTRRLTNALVDIQKGNAGAPSKFYDIYVSYSIAYGIEVLEELLITHHSNEALKQLLESYRLLDQ